MSYSDKESRTGSSLFSRKTAWIGLLLCAVLFIQLRGLNLSSSDLEAVLGEPRRARSTAQSRLGPLPPNESSDVCPQAQPLNPVGHRGLESKLASVFADEAYKRSAYKALGGAVQIPSASYDDLRPVGEDERWEIFGELHKYLEKTFPRVFESLKVTKVNTYGISLHWQGSDDSLLPVLMAAHQDVVPIEPTTVDEWIHPPFSGYYDGTWIWGRGTCDDKSDLIASFHAIDALLQHGFQPERTFVWAFGFDEESAGTEGAGHLATYLEQRYGTNGFALLLDEGGSYGTPYGDEVIFAVPSLTEKGYIDIRIEITTKGGHSSVPPPHTAIGMLSAMITAVESNPHTPELIRNGSPYNSTMCAAAYGPNVPEPLRHLASSAAHSDAALAALEAALLASAPKFAAILGTTQAVDLIQGGVKVNALPEQVAAVVNHRIAEHSSVAAVQAHVAAAVLPVARRFDLSLDAFGVPGSGAGSGAGGHVALSDAWGTALEPSPATPTGEDDPYQILAGTIKATIESAAWYNASGVVVAPALSLGNTDTRYYWNLTRNIFRYKHMHEKDRYNGAHTVNEAVRAEGWIESIRFYTKFILNCDEHL